MVFTMEIPLSNRKEERYLFILLNKNQSAIINLFPYINDDCIPFANLFNLLERQIWFMYPICKFKLIYQGGKRLWQTN